MRRLLVVALIALGCASRSRNTPQETALASDLHASGVQLHVLYDSPEARDLPRLQLGLATAAPQLARWGPLPSPVTVRLYPDHATFEAAIDRHGYPWLRAWTLDDQMWLQSPKSWGFAPDREIAELLSHELTHALMYETCAGRGDPPIWFSEGMASVTAGQGARRLSRREVSAFLSRSPGVDLLNPLPETYRTQKDLVYSAAHHAFEDLIALIGDGGVKEVLRRIGAGESFAQAFESISGKPLSEFERGRFQLAGL